MEKWTDEIHTALASSGARTRTEVPIDFEGRARRVRMEVYREDKEANEHCFKIKTADTDGKRIAVALKALKNNADIVCEAKRAVYHEYGTETFDEEGMGTDVWLVWAKGLEAT